MEDGGENANNSNNNNNNMENRLMKTEEKMLKYGPLRWELKLQYPGYKVSQHDIIMDVLGGYSKDVRKSIKCFIGDRCHRLSPEADAEGNAIMHFEHCKEL